MALAGSGAATPEQLRDRFRRFLDAAPLPFVRGQAPHCRETLIDDGEVDILRVLAILRRNGFDGVVIPDHAPRMSCAAPWHAGMAFALGYFRAGPRFLGLAP